MEIQQQDNKSNATEEKHNWQGRKHRNQIKLLAINYNSTPREEEGIVCVLREPTTGSGAAASLLGNGILITQLLVVVVLHSFAFVLCTLCARVKKHLRRVC